MFDKRYCMSHYLAFRFISDENINFFNGLKHTVFKPLSKDKTISVKNIDDIENVIKNRIDEFYTPDKTAILLSGGIDSAILASYLPIGTKAYTFKCIADGAIDETKRAEQYEKKYKLNHQTIDLFWDYFEKLTP